MADKDALIRREAGRYLEREEVPGGYVMHPHPGGAGPFGGDRRQQRRGALHSVARGPPAVGARIWRQLRARHGLRRLGVIITDSRSAPFAPGVLGFALAHWGFRPLRDYRGRRDVFGRRLRFSQANVADALGGGAGDGRGAEQTPLALIRGPRGCASWPGRGGARNASAGWRCLQRTSTGPSCVACPGVPASRRRLGGTGPLRVGAGARSRASSDGQPGTGWAGGAGHRRQQRYRAGDGPGPGGAGAAVASWPAGTGCGRWWRRSSGGRGRRRCAADLADGGAARAVEAAGERLGRLDVVVYAQGTNIPAGPCRCSARPTGMPSWRRTSAGPSP